MSFAVSPPTTSDFALTASILAAVSAYLFAVQRATAAGLLSSVATRKLVHITCGPAFVALWPFYSHAVGARLLAATIPLLFTGVLLVSGTTRAAAAAADTEAAPTDRRGALARALSRDGKASEALEGPLYYSVTLLVLTLALFQSAAAGIAVCQLCVGDGLAEVFGRWLGRGTEWSRVRMAVANGLNAAVHTEEDEQQPKRVAKGKSVAGSAAFVAGAAAASLACVQWLSVRGLTSVRADEPDVVACVVALSALCAGVELAPRSVIGDDNVAIALVAVAASVAVWGGAVL